MLKRPIWEALLWRKPACLPSASQGTLTLPGPERPYATCLHPLVPLCRAEQRYLPIASLADALQGAHRLLEKANLTEEESLAVGEKNFQEHTSPAGPCLKDTGLRREPCPACTAGARFPPVAESCHSRS